MEPTHIEQEMQLLTSYADTTSQNALMGQIAIIGGLLERIALALEGIEEIERNSEALR